MSDVKPEIVLRHDAGGIATLTLNRPEARNALSLEMMTTLTAALEAVGGDPAVKVVVLAANGPAFCAGHDLKELQSDRSVEASERVFQTCAKLMMTITRLPKPVVARVHAMATAAGCQLVATCDLAIAADCARFATPGVNIGLFCSTPMVALTRAVGRKPAMEMLLTGLPIHADEAQRIGLINRVVTPGQLDIAVHELCETIASKSPYTLALGKEAFYRQAEMGLEEAYAYAAAVMVKNMQAKDAAEGVDAFINKRHPVWCGC
ncbi:putative enoyl-CoA hydratase echA8 [mine drainage metagenome]|uniref:Enoyl-CoA hydratase domain-containing protein 3, mitochondrial n=1 Tax=mine drainage metagenome TaxID=410659 RepID=A0A1J5RRU6_9ZZZZ